MIRNLLIIIFAGIFLFSCAQNRIEVVKYRDFYKFNDVLKIKSLVFKPFPDNIAFKTKNTLILKNHKKYSFYSAIYSYKNYCRIFCYTLFGKRVVDIFFVENLIYFVPSKSNEVYVIDVKKKDLKESIFNFIKDVVKGIELKKVFKEDRCYVGIYNQNFAKVCLESNFRKLVIEKKVVNIIEMQNNYPKKIILNLDQKVMKISIKKYFKPENDPKVSFFESIKNFKRYYIKNLISLEKAIFLENNNENK